MPSRPEAIAALQDAMGYAFTDADLLDRALTHASAGEGTRPRAHNQRLEFLGDRVLGLVIAERVMRDHPQSREGDMSARFHALVDKPACARVARRAGLGDALRIGKGAGLQGLRESENVLGDACEALLAAVYLDGGLDAARSVVERLWGDDIQQASRGYTQSAKTRLSEWANKAGVTHPIYRVLDRQGPDHAPEFTVAVELEGRPPTRGRGRNKLEAEQAAAAALLEALT